MKMVLIKSNKIVKSKKKKLKKIIPFAEQVCLISDTPNRPIN